MNEKDEEVPKQDWLLKQDLSKLDPSKLTPLTEEVWRVLKIFKDFILKVISRQATINIGK